MSVGSRSKLISERSDGFGIGDLAIVSEEHEKGDSLSDEADDEEEMSKAAMVIQGKFRERKISREQYKRGDTTNPGLCL